MTEALCTVLVRARAISWDPALHPDQTVWPCENCGTWSPGERHHRKFRSRGGLWLPSNVVILCRGCHVSATDEAPWVVESGLNVHSWEESTEVPVWLWHEHGLCLLDDEGGYRRVDKA